jgi:hypothetical protein
MRGSLWPTRGPNPPRSHPPAPAWKSGQHLRSLATTAASSCLWPRHACSLVTIAVLVMIASPSAATLILSYPAEASRSQDWAPRIPPPRSRTSSAVSPNLKRHHRKRSPEVYRRRGKNRIFPSCFCLRRFPTPESMVFTASPSNRRSGSSRLPRARRSFPWPPLGTRRPREASRGRTISSGAVTR